MSPPLALEAWVEPAALVSLGDAARQAAARLRLPLRRQPWRGRVGNWDGVGYGASVEFQDHRPYVPGDDPRRVDWAAFARSGQLAMKLYREEVSPAVELIVDASRSMRAFPAKRDRVVELVLFCAAAAEAAAAPTRVWAVLGDRHALVAAEDVRQARLVSSAPQNAEPTTTGALGALPLRPGSLRVLVSDCLFPSAPAALLRDLIAHQGRALVLAPFDVCEREPDWSGSLEMVDCESLESRSVRIDSGRLDRYRAAWRRHFEAWRDESRRHGAAFAQVASSVPLGEALNSAVEAGALEPA